MRYIMIAVLVIGIVLTGCIGNSVKICDSSECMEAAFQNNCEEAYYEGEFQNKEMKSSVSEEEEECVYVREVYSDSGDILFKTVCLYDQPDGNYSDRACFTMLG